MVRHVFVCALILVAGGCGDGTAPSPGEPDRARDAEDWETLRKAQSGADAVVRAAYYFMIEHPDRTDATLDEIVATRADPEFVYVAAERAKTDPWGRRLRLAFESRYVIIATAAGPAAHSARRTTCVLRRMDGSSAWLVNPARR